MYISELNLHGFKSFAKKEKLKFGEGVTVIVGPNGCGKTNIVDAIRWVLGEQKYSVLRSNKMGDVIFNGADGLKPLSVCEATLTVHNNRGKLPLEYNDIEICRRVYRNGESEFFINRTPCRLKDIHDLFVDTGMGSDAYSVIELKMIEQILSETADDRKRMFEEAAGINKYKQQRKSTLRKFDAVRQDLERVGDIVQEVEQKVHALNLQLKRFKRHEILSDELKDKELSLAFVRIHEYDSDIIPLRQRVVEFTHLKDETASDTSNHENELKYLKGLYKDQQGKLQLLQNTLNDMEVNRESARNNVLVWSEQDKAAEATILRLNREDGINADKKVQLTSQMGEHETEIAAISPKVDEQLIKYKSKKSKFEKVATQYKNAQKDLETAQGNRWDAQRSMGDNRSLLDRTISLIEEKNNTISRMNEKIQEIEINHKTQGTEQIELESKKSKWVKSIGKIQSQLNIIRETLNIDREKRSTLSMGIHSGKSRMESLQSQVAFYTELIEQKEGYPEGVRTALDSPQEYHGIIGTVGELFQIDEKYDAAFQSALGDWAKCLVAEDRKSALEILAKAKSQKIGNLSILPLKELSQLKQSQSKTPKGMGIIGAGTDLCGTDKKIQSLANVMVGNLLIVENLNEALNNHNLDGWDVVDLNGAYSGKNYVLKHRAKSGDGSLLGRQKKIDSLNLAISELEKSVAQQENDFALLGTDIEGQSVKSKTLGENLETVSLELQDIETGLIRNHYGQSQSLESLKGLQLEVKETTQTIEDLQSSVKKLEPGLAKGEVVIEKLKSIAEKASKALVKIQVDRDTFQQAVQELRIELLNLENKRDNLNFQKRVAEETIHELEERKTSIESEISELGSQRELLTSQIANGETELQSITGQLAKDKSILDLKRSTANDTYQSMEKIQEKIRSEQQSRETLLEELKTNELKIAEMEQRIVIIRERIKDRYELEVPMDLIVDEEADDLELRIDRIQRSIESIGPINMAVQQEYEDEQTRLQTLMEQRDDLTESEDNLRETIQKIDKVARKKFQETFDQIKLNFSKLFDMFFEGGTASLTLVGDPDPLEADIAIHAQPPGKRNQSLRMLSAGEKSLTAIALLFAIYQYKPSPYCILDEVDAPLDDVNIEKFKRVLNKFADETQFIVVTHNKLTMEVADYLYGVTMEQKGVSKLVSVKFNE
ncbi:MAG: chromosome segregation protein SMC [Candidatus Marinimicrobia bacterium]|jgi:chromosome segregation protein|nr:chromosome segregation protein SMC [Candidatus Neomarinimicrobiota bacterium]MBT3763773.1 chromosome segregation protein SMC [Candidatus Neomarinimicrobiota bacterium]MBT4270044.1 chromosome segregation protein SMC [Candidatus Neomarinimicrobiota bacterium]MBT4372171.1 chromosome segregation protein SMC [Candidatus Neomarinimicrobiota bacterium]MBT4808620.1 chromosome segregation protein SMC [Candidatus Neomarinimicrobiota bacterium]